MKPLPDMPADRIVSRAARFFTSRRKATIGVVAAGTLFFAFGIFSLRSELVVQDLLPSDHPYIRMNFRFSRFFDTGEGTVLFCLKSRQGSIFHPAFLEKLKKLTEEVSFLDEVYPRDTRSIASLSSKVVQTRAHGEIVVHPLMFPNVPKGRIETESLRQEIDSDPAYRGRMVSRDGTAALVITAFRPDVSFDRIHRVLRRLTQAYTDESTSLHIVGFPALMGWIQALWFQAGIVFFISVLTACLVSVWLFRSRSKVFVPMANAGILTVWGMGAAGYAGANLSPLILILAFLVVARVIANSNQILLRYLEELALCGKDRQTACFKTMEAMLVPNLTAVSTDAAGFAVLSLSGIPLMKQTAAIMTFWVLSIAATGILTPVISSLLPLSGCKWSLTRDKVLKDRYDGLWSLGYRLAGSRPARCAVLAGLLLFLGFCGWQVRERLRYGDLEAGSSLLWPTHPYNQDQNRIDSLFHMSSDSFILFHEGEAGSTFRPDVLAAFEAFDRYMQDRLPDIYKSSESINDMIGMVNFQLHEGDPVWLQIPQEDSLAAFLAGYIRQNAEIEFMSRFADLEWKRSRMILYFTDHTPESLSRILDAAAGFFASDREVLLPGAFSYPGGRIGLEAATNQTLRHGHRHIDFAAFALIFLLCAIAFRSVSAGLMLSLPLAASSLAALGFMSLLGIGISLITLPVVAVGAGLGVDFAIYLYSRCREESILSGDWNIAVQRASRSCGRASVYTGLTIVLPLSGWCLIGDLKFQAQMGIFLALIVGMNVLFAVILHPFLLSVLQPAFIRRTPVDRNTSPVRGPFEEKR